MHACILNLPIGDITPDLCDHRYFFSGLAEDQAKCGFSLCGVARNAMAKALRRYGANRSSENHMWLQNLPYLIHNRSMTGFLIENCCLSAIALKGLPISMGLSAGMVTISFSGEYPVYTLTESLAIYCPTRYNFPAINAIIVRLDPTENRKRAWLFPLQVTVAEDHEDTEPMFFAHWARWSHQLTMSGFEVEAHFLWITPEKCYSTKKVKAKAHASSRGETLINPDYTSHRIPLNLVSQDISGRYQSAVGGSRQRKGKKRRPSFLSRRNRLKVILRRWGKTPRRPQ